MKPDCSYKIYLQRNQEISTQVWGIVRHMYTAKQTGDIGVFVTFAAIDDLSQLA